MQGDHRASPSLASVVPKRRRALSISTREHTRQGGQLPGVSRGPDRGHKHLPQGPDGYRAEAEGRTLGVFGSFVKSNLHRRPRSKHTFITVMDHARRVIEPWQIAEST